MSNYLSVSSLTKYWNWNLIRILFGKVYPDRSRSQFRKRPNHRVIFIKGWKSGYSGDGLGWGLSKLWFELEEGMKILRHRSHSALWAKWELFHCHWKGWARRGRDLGANLSSSRKVDRRALSGPVEASSATISRKIRGYRSQSGAVIRDIIATVSRRFLV